MLGEYREDADRVTIIGAGLAGLMAAFELKKLRIPFQIFEAGHRPGGRLQGLPGFHPDVECAELGGEWFSGRQRLVFETARDLRVDIHENKELFRYLRILRKGRMIPWTEVSADLSRIQRNLRRERAPETGTMNLRDWVQAQSAGALTTEMVDQWSLGRYGVPAAEIAAFPFAEELRSTSQSLAPWTEQRFRFRQGTAGFVRAFHDRVAGLQPDRVFAFSHRWTGVRIRPHGYELRFKAPDGEVSFITRWVICTVPAGVLRTVEGIDEIPGPWDQPDEFKMGVHGKVLLSYPRRFWSSLLNQGRLENFLPAASLWESSFPIGHYRAFKQGVLTVQIAGEAAHGINEEMSEKIQRELARIFREPSAEAPGDQALVNWGTRPLSGGSVSYPSPHLKSRAWPGDLGHWQWAGEHTSDAWRGTLQGALLSGRAAVERIARTRDISG